ncbi:hypothetical protein CPB85DRAFT_815697 [Mucidula mucida]|nr:hypothetical protein CPB85DRAFT_815697 [Mucidula mucida]
MSYTPAQEQYILRSFVHGYIIEVIGYGMETVLFLLTLSRIASAASKGPWIRKRIVLAILVTLMWALMTIRTGLEWWYLDFFVIVHGDTRESMLMAAVVQGPYPTAVRYGAVGATCTVANIILADITNIWRCWILYGQRWVVTLLPSMTLMGSIATWIYFQYINYAVIPDLNSGDSGANLYLRSALAYTSLIIATNTITTGLIIFRIISVTGTKKVRTYRGIIEIFVESAFMYAVIYIIYIAVLVQAFHSTNVDQTPIYVIDVANVITVIAPTLIIARSVSGEGKPDDSWASTSLPHMRSGRRNISQSIRFAKPRDTAQTTTTDDVFGRDSYQPAGILSLGGKNESRIDAGVK